MTALRNYPPATMPADWRYQVLAQVDSTNSYAARLPAWSAVRAEIQTGGRGRTPDRRWVSDTGGLWLSAVLPCPAPRSQWETLPLAAGWAVVNAVRAVGVMRPRLRWPNDVMIGDAKLAGVLVERYTDETAVVGVGLNVCNAPAAADPALAGRTVRLADLIGHAYSIEDLARRVLGELRAAHHVLANAGFAPIADELNYGWSETRRVEITLVGGRRPVGCRFHGVDLHGRLRVTTPPEQTAVYDASQVELFRELPN
jgi:BirA family biotin operon repressor/biotin-[acetyl-CoA-carboxylase] ligase